MENIDKQHAFYLRRIKHCDKRIKECEEKYQGKENKHTFYAGQNYGYWKGMKEVYLINLEWIEDNFKKDLQV